MQVRHHLRNFSKVWFDLDVSGGESCPKRLFLYLDVKIDNLRDREDLADKIHAMGYKAASGVINPIPENPVLKMKELLNKRFDYIYSEGIPYFCVR